MQETPQAILTTYMQDFSGNIFAIFTMLIPIIIGIVVLFFGFKKVKTYTIRATAGDAYITRKAKNTSHTYTTGQTDTFLKFH